MQPTAQQLLALRAALAAVVETVKEAGQYGAPGGVMYAEMMKSGVNLTQFESMMGVLVRNGNLSKQGDLYFWLKDLDTAA